MYSFALYCDEWGSVLRHPLGVTASYFHMVIWRHVDNSIPLQRMTSLHRRVQSPCCVVLVASCLKTTTSGEYWTYPISCRGGGDLGRACNASFLCLNMKWIFLYYHAVKHGIFIVYVAAVRTDSAHRDSRIVSKCLILFHHNLIRTSS